jgi:hypothetical protein
MLKKAIFVAVLGLGFVTSFHFGKGEILPSKVEITTPAGACCDPWDTQCCMISGACCS